jgi:ABC-2 type transport system permease protein
VLLVLLGSIFGHEAAAAGVSVGQLFTAGMIAGGIGSTSFQNLGLSIATERERGTLKQLRGTPMSPAAYFIGKIILVFVCTVGEVAVLLVLGVTAYHLHLPTSAARWWTLAWVFVLGTLACSLIGIAISSLAQSRNSFPVISLPFIVLQFISGVFVPFNNVPPWLQHIAAIFPLKWMSEGLSSALLPDQAARILERSDSWQHGLTAVVLLAWVVGGLVLCLRTFRWRSSKDG